MDWYTEVLKELKKATGFEYEAYKMSMLIRRIDNRINTTNLSSPEKYFELLSYDNLEMSLLNNNFYINVSHFFRDPIVFEYLSNKILPEFFNSNSRSIRVWSAGCSTGEEPYSFSIILNEFLEKEKLCPEIYFFSTDADTLALKKAKQGLYDLDQLSECKLKYFSKYFTEKQNGYQLSDNIRNMVNFSYDDLLDKTSYAPKESIYGDFDFILCRNVLIYFNEEYHSRIFEKIIKSLKVGGTLILGEVESIPRIYSKNFIQLNEACKIYRRIK